MSMKCTFEGCGRPSKTRGYCGAHYLRLRRSGELIMRTEALASTGRKADNPLYTRWNKAMAAGKLCERWADFWVFVEDVGDSNGCTKMLRRDLTRPLGPDNFYWAEKLEGERKNAYYRNYYKANNSVRDGLYRKLYGIGLADYEAMSDAQGHVCAICGTPESRKVRAGTNEDQRKLAIDHDHETGGVRGLLCGACNQTLGLMKDSVDRLQSAIDYLVFHKRKRLKVVE